MIGFHSQSTISCIFWFSTIDRLKHLILPAFVLGLSHLAVYTTYIRSGMLEALHRDYIITARAKGLHERTITYKHAFRNALLPFITLLGLSVPWLISGSVVIETIWRTCFINGGSDGSSCGCMDRHIYWTYCRLLWGVSRQYIDADC